MIFITIGSQEPFDRLLQIMDDLAPTLKNVPIVAQNTKSNFQPKHIQTVEFIPPAEFQDYLKKADLVIGHAGMGTILTVLEIGKPMIVFPRRGHLKEATNDHQVDTAKAFEQQGLLHAAYDAAQLKEKIGAFLQGRVAPVPPIHPYASQELISSISDFLDSSQTSKRGRLPSLLPKASI